MIVLCFIDRVNSETDWCWIDFKVWMTLIKSTVTNTSTWRSNLQATRRRDSTKTFRRKCRDFRRNRHTLYHQNPFPVKHRYRTSFQPTALTFQSSNEKRAKNRWRHQRRNWITHSWISTETNLLSLRLTPSPERCFRWTSFRRRVATLSKTSARRASPTDVLKSTPSSTSTGRTRWTTSRSCRVRGRSRPVSSLGFGKQDIIETPNIILKENWEKDNIERKEE